MAVYTPAQLISPAILGNGSANIATWRVRDTANVNIHRTTIFASTGADAVTVELGATAATTVAQRIVSAQVLTINVALVFNWWQVAKINDYFEGFANSVNVVGSSSGYSFA